MTDRSSDVSLSREIGSLVDTLEALQREVEPGNRERRRLPTPGELLRFTSEVTIPAAILVLETNVRVLKLLQRAIRTTAGEPAKSSSGPSAEAVRERVETLGQQTLTQLDQTLADLQSAVEGRPADDDAVALLAEARRLQDDVQRELAGNDQPGVDTASADSESVDPGPSNGVPVDVDAEIASIKEQLDQDGEGNDGRDDSGVGDGSDGTGAGGPGDDTSAGDTGDGTGDDGNASGE